MDRSEAWIILGGYISIYPPASLPFISRGPRNMRYIRRTIAEEERRIRGTHRQVHEKEKSIPQRKDDWQWTRVTKSHAYVSLRRTVALRTRCKVVAGYQTWELKRLFGMQISLIEGKR